MMYYKFINKSLFFPKQGILAIGDLHIGYEAMLRQSGVLVPERQVKDIIKDLEKIFQEIGPGALKKIIFLGDIKHAFNFEKKEANEFRQILQFLGERFPEENIIILKGNHDTVDYAFEGKLKDYHVEGNIAFIHGHEHNLKIFDKKIKTIVSGHLHPSVIFSKAAKKESYKCFLVGNYKSKEIIILPSFLEFTEGTPVNFYHEDYVENFSIIPKKSIMNFKVYAIGKNQVLDFGRIKDL